jgi:hypothetical protein
MCNLVKNKVTAVIKLINSIQEDIKSNPNLQDFIDLTIGRSSTDESKGGY